MLTVYEIYSQLKETLDRDSLINYFVNIDTLKANAANSGWSLEGLDKVYEDLAKGGISLDEIKGKMIARAKAKARAALAAEIGDNGDNIMDISLAVALAECIRAGVVTDSEIIKGFTTYSQTILEGYGGAAAVLAILNADLLALGKHIIGGYKVAATQIVMAKDASELSTITF